MDKNMTTPVLRFPAISGIRRGGRVRRGIWNRPLLPLAGPDPLAAGAVRGRQ